MPPRATIPFHSVAVTVVGVALLTWGLARHPLHRSSTELDIASVAAIRHRDVIHGPHVFLGEEQWTWGRDNQLCVRGGTDSATRCPAQCEAVAVQQGRVRRAVHTLSEAEWQRVVDAMFVVATVNTTVGMERYGSGYRDMTFHQIFHALSACMPICGLEPN